MKIVTLVRKTYTIQMGETQAQNLLNIICALDYRTESCNSFSDPTKSEAETLDDLRQVFLTAGLKRTTKEPE